VTNGYPWTNVSYIQAQGITNGYPWGALYDPTNAAHYATNGWPWTVLSDPAGSATAVTNGYPWGVLYDAAGRAAAATNGFPWGVLYDPAGAAQNATNGLGSAAFKATGYFDVAGAAQAATNSYHWGVLYDPAGAASGVTNGYPWTNLTVAHASAVTNGYPWTNVSYIQAQGITNGYPWTNIVVSSNQLPAALQPLTLRDGGSVTNLQATNVLGVMPIGTLATSNQYSIGGVLTLDAGGARVWTNVASQLGASGGVQTNYTNVWTGTNTFTQPTLLSNSLSFLAGTGTSNQIIGASDQPLAIFPANSVQVSATVAGNALNIIGGNATAGSGTNSGANGGAITILGGRGASKTPGSGMGGAVNIKGGAASSTAYSGADNGGAVNITGGNGTSGSGGSVVITSGTSSGVQASGDVTITVADCSVIPGTLSINGGGTTAMGIGGAVNVVTKPGGVRSDNSSAAPGPGGNLTMTIGAGGSQTSTDSIATNAIGATAGSFVLSGGAGGSATRTTLYTTGGNGSAVSLAAGAGGAASSTNGLAGNGGAITLSGGTGGAATSVNGVKTGGNGSTLTFNSGNGGAARGTTNSTGGNSGDIVMNIRTNGTGGSANGSYGTFQVNIPTSTNQMTVSATGVQVAGNLTATNVYAGGYGYFTNGVFLMMTNTGSANVICTTNKQVYLINATNALVTLPNAAQCPGVVYRFAATNGWGSFTITNATGLQTIRDGTSLSYKQVGIGSPSFFSDGAHWWPAAKTKTIMPCASWSATTNIPMTAANTMYPVTYNVQEFNDSQGMALLNGSQIWVTNTGQYFLSFSAVVNPAHNNDTMWLWLRQDGTNFLRSATPATPGTATVLQTMTVNFILTVTGPTYFELEMQANNTGCVLQATSATGNIPDSPSIIVTINRVSDGWP
jgi:hypothetical protein